MLTMYVVLEIVFVPYLLVIAGVCIRGLVRRDTFRAKRSVKWTSRWGSEAVEVFQRAADLGAWGVLTASMGLVLLLLGTPISGALYAVAVVVLGVGCVLVGLSQRERMRALKLAVAYQHLPATAVRGMPSKAGKDPSAFDEWVATCRGRA